jgi:hypothetical protein
MHCQDESRSFLPRSEVVLRNAETASMAAVPKLFLPIALCMCSNACVSPFRSTALECDPRQRSFIVAEVSDAQFHETFTQLNQFASGPVIYAEQGESALLHVHACLYTAGDRRFTVALGREPLAVRRVVAKVFPASRITRQFPATAHLLTSSIQVSSSPQ